MRPIGARIAERFEVVTRVAAGGMGELHLARDLTTGERVALKLLAPGADRGRFDREARLLASLRHPGIVRYVAHGVAGAEAFLAMEWLEGEDLAGRLQRGPLAPAEAIALLADAARAVGEAHRHGVVHHDLKPS